MVGFTTILHDARRRLPFEILSSEQRGSSGVYVASK